MAVLVLDVGIDDLAEEGNARDIASIGNVAYRFQQLKETADLSPMVLRMAAICRAFRKLFSSTECNYDCVAQFPKNPTSN